MYYNSPNNYPNSKLKERSIANDSGGVIVEKGQWTFLSNHGRVFVFIAKHPQSTTETISQEVGLSRRGVQKIICGLELGGYVVRCKEGRHNHYIVHPEMPMRHHLERDHAVGDILAALGYHSTSDRLSE